MNCTDIRSKISDITAELVDLNDWAVNTFREHCRDMGYTDQKGVYAIEAERIKREELTIEQYLRVRRTGQRYRLTREARKAVWTICATKHMLKWWQ